MSFSLARSPCSLVLAAAFLLSTPHALSLDHADADGSLFIHTRPEADKRAPFSSWAGKRSLHRTNPDLAQLVRDLNALRFLNDMEEEEEAPAAFAYTPAATQKRAPFSSWAGKRAPFSSWAGKKKRAPFSSWAGKRAPFSSWAGKKRSSEEDWQQEDASLEPKRRLKRSSVEDDQHHPRERRGAGSFSAWGGKRTQLRRFTRNAPSDAAAASGIVPVRVLRPQRAAFSAWGG